MDERLRAVVEALLPAADPARTTLAHGQFHDVVLAPGHGVVRVARRAEAARLLARRAALTARLGGIGLSFAVPVPLGEVREVEGLTAVALSWVPGTPRPSGCGDPAPLAALLAELREVPVGALDGLLDVPHAYAGRERWEELLREEVVPRLPADLRADAVRRVAEACALPDVPATLVHGDLAGDNLHWHEDGRLAGVLDWDLASAFDPAVDAACLAWFGWDAVAAAVDPATLARARTWFATFALEQVSSALADDAPADEVDAAVARAAEHLRAH